MTGIKERGGAKRRGRSMRQEEGGGTCNWLALGLVGTDPPSGEGDGEPHAGATVPRSPVGVTATCVWGGGGGRSGMEEV